MSIYILSAVLCDFARVLCVFLLVYNEYLIMCERETLKTLRMKKI